MVEADSAAEEVNSAAAAGEAADSAVAGDAVGSAPELIDMFGCWYVGGSTMTAHRGVR